MQLLPNGDIVLNKEDQDRLCTILSDYADLASTAVNEMHPAAQAKVDTFDREYWQLVKS